MALGLLIAPPTLAWGPQGHQIIGHIASQLLAPDVRLRVDKLLERKSLAEVGPLPDEWRLMLPIGSSWHFVAIPRSASEYDPQRDCPPQESAVGRTCAVAAIEHYRAVLADDKALSGGSALIWLAHLVGDIHQPFHVTDDMDLGGNRISVQFFGEPTNLHAVWDSGILRHADIPPETYATTLLARATAAPRPPTSDARAVIDWVNGSHALGAQYAYPPSGGDAGYLVDEAYYERSRTLIENQLLLAGERLAALLNATLSERAPELPAGAPAPTDPGRR